jgi:hypothetical protein
MKLLTLLLAALLPIHVPLAAEDKPDNLKITAGDGSATLKQNDVLSLPAVHLNRLLHFKP